MMMALITGKTRILGVAGFPVSHSLSPLIHNRWFTQLGIDAVYITLPIRPEKFCDMLIILNEMGFWGLNVTIPYKEKILQFCNEISPTAKKIEAVNTISFKNGKIYGDNTDKDGFLYGLSKKNIDLSTISAVSLIGAGGAARAVALALIELGIKEIFLINRSIEKAEALADKISVEGKIKPVALEEINDVLPKSDMVINATSVGLNNRDILPIDFTKIKHKILFYDTVYSPLETELLYQAKKRDHFVIDGLDMLIGQARLSFSIWFEKKPPKYDFIRPFLIENGNIRQK